MGMASTQFRTSQVRTGLKVTIINYDLIRNVSDSFFNHCHLLSSFVIIPSLLFSLYCGVCIILHWLFSYMKHVINHSKQVYDYFAFFFSLKI